MRVLAFGACVVVGALAQPEEVGPSVDPTVAAAIKAEWSVSAAAKKKEPRQKLTFVVPVRNRPADVTQLIEKLLDFSMPHSNLEPSIYIAEQVESYAGVGSDAWNKGRLYNAAVAEMGDQAGATIVFQDVDVWETCPRTLSYWLCLDGGAHRLFGYPAGAGIGLVMGESLCCVMLPEPD
jgi:hypothetical protein